MKSHNDRIYKAKWLDNGMIISCGKDRTVKQADFDTGKAFLMAKNERGAIMDFDVSGTLLAFAGEDGVCGLIDLKKPKELVHSFVSEEGESVVGNEEPERPQGGI